MKLLTLLLFTLLLVSGCSRPEYEFHVSGNGGLMWRCNRITGEVEFCVVSDTPQWVKVHGYKTPVAKTPVAAPVSSNGVPDGFILEAPQKSK